jgi:anti-sigma factor RsiW
MKFTDTDLVLYADGLLSPERKQWLLGLAEQNPGLAGTLAALEASRLPYKAAFDHQSLPDVPEKLRDNIRDWSIVTREYGGGQSTAGGVCGWSVGWAQVMCLALCLGIGYVVGTISTVADLVAGRADRTVQAEWVERIASYQSLYVANTISDINPNPERVVQSIKELFSAYGINATIPDLSEAGYTLARVQELGYEGRPLIQLIYSGEGRVPLALCLMRTTGLTDSAPAITRFDGLQAIDWIAANQRFVIVADESELTLKALAKIAQART